MAFGGSGGFTFGQQNNQQSSGGFGGFGGSGSSNNNNPNTGGAFGSNTSNSGFGSSTAQNNPFGSSTFGGGSNSNPNTTGFGNNSNTGSSLFGNKPATTSLFGNNASSTTGSGGLFSNTNSNTNTAGGFGGSSGGFGGGSTTNNAFGTSTTSGSGAFGGGFGNQNKTNFGTNSSSAPLFGQGGAGTTGSFGSTTGPFGNQGSGTALQNQPVGPSEGTAAVPFAPVQDKENTQSVVYNTISFQPPYGKYSLEELRVADYNAGRRFGNGGGQTGAFGASNFGGFGSNSNNNSGTAFGTSSNSNPFGSNTTSSGGFNANTSTAFGPNNSTGGSLFGNKAAGGGLFAQQASSSTGGGLFGNSNTQNTNSSNPFGTSGSGAPSNAFGASTGGGLFGNNQTQSKSLFGPTSTTSNNSTGLFANTQSNTSGGNMFGNNNNQQQQQQQQPSGGLFGNNNQQQPKPSMFGGLSTGPFGQTSTQPQQSQQSGGLFGNAANNNTGGSSLFGPSNTGNSGGLFANSTNNTGGGLFSNQNNNASKPGGIFGGTNAFGNSNQQSSGGGLFGNNNASTSQAGGGLFSGNQNQPSNSFSFNQNNQNKPAGSMFGNSTNQSSGLFNNNNNSNSMFGGSMSQPQQNQQQQDGIRHASLLDPNPYGQSSIWTGLPTPNMENSKPLVTPLVATQKLKESQAKPPPNLRLNQSRYMTPPRRTGTYGFTYSTYGTPNSVASTPGGNGLSNSMYVSRFSGGSFGRSMGKAASVSNLRSHYTDGESVLTPGAFAPSASRYSSGSIRRLHIDRSIKNDLFTRPALPALISPPAVPNGLSRSEPPPASASLEAPPDTTQKLRKRVSFDRDVTGGQSNGDLNGNTGALVRTEFDDDVSPTQDREVNGAAPPVEQPRGNELAAVPEDRESDAPITKKQPRKEVSLEDPKMGDYWMKPTRAEMGKMSRDKLKKLVGFEVGRHGAGQVRFDGAVDLTSINFDELFVSIVDIRARSVTVYPDASSKPPPGKGLNVPSTISIENSWPRARGKPTLITSGPLFDKHLKRLMNIEGTEFQSYDSDTGVWTFRVPHYTRYGLDYDEDEMDEDFGESMLSAPPDSIEQYKGADMSVMEMDSDNDSSRQDDTFSFKQKTVPGGFGRQPIIDDEPEDALVRSIEHDTDGSDHSALSEEEISDDDMDMMAGSYPEPNKLALNFESPAKPILKPGLLGTPGKPLLDLDGDWAEQLQRTISPRKQNRNALREAQNKILLDRVYSPIKPKTAVQKKDFRTSLDVMNAIFDGPERRTRAGKKGRGQAEPDFEFPYAKRAKTFDPNEDDLSDADKAWHASFKPNFTTTGQLVCKVSPKSALDEEWEREALVMDEDTVVGLSQLKPSQPLDIASMLKYADIVVEKGSDVPKIRYANNIPFSVVGASLPTHLTSTGLEEAYELLHVLFDEYEDEYSYGITQQQKQDFEERIKKDRLNQFLMKMLADVDANKIAVAEKQRPLEAAVRYLAKHDIKAACDVLTKSKNFHLSLLIAQIANADEEFQNQMGKQIEAWRGQNVISEMDEDVRTLYELLSGNTTVSQGKPTGAVEDRASTFTISQKYELSWLQAFALSCWYGQVKEGSVAEWMEDFQQKVDAKEETAVPDDDPLWIVLKLYASLHKDSEVEKPVLPQALSALETKWDVGAAVQLYNSVAATLEGDGVQLDKDAAVKLAATFASQLEMKGDVVGAVFALLHLDSTTKRQVCVQDLLNRHAAILPALTATNTDDTTLSLLTHALKLPMPWMAKSKALHARATHQSGQELQYLIMAKEHEEAHTCLCRRVAPRMVIDEEYEGLGHAIEMFKDVDTGYLMGWEDGGAVYSAFAQLAMTTTTMVGGAPAKAKGDETTKALDIVRRGLESLQSKFAGRALTEGGLEELEERVAIKEMGRVVSGIMEGEGEGLKGMRDVLGLPLMDGERRSVGVEMGVGYYKRVMGSS